MEPVRTYAVVVGIEKYELPKSDLSGPGGDAVCFVEWLRKNAVPAENIFLFLSPLKEKRAELESRLKIPEVGVSSKPAVRLEIETCLRGLGKPGEFVGDLLYLFWGGHGIADDTNKRYLFYADTTESTLEHHLDVRSWLKLLRSYHNLPKQIGYIDACANLKPQWKVGVNEVTSGPGNASQSVFFAAAVGQRAANDDLIRSGRFSHLLREAIAGVQKEDKTWPPSPRQVIESLCERFCGDRTQKPVFYEAGDFEGNTFADGDLPASEVGSYYGKEFVEAVARDSGYAVNDLRAWAEEASRSKILSEQANRDIVLRHLETLAKKPNGALGPILSHKVEDWLRTFAIAVRFRLLTQLQKRLEGFDTYAMPLTQKIRAASDLNELCKILDRERPEPDLVQRAYLLTINQRRSGENPPQNLRDKLRAFPLSVDDGLRNSAEFVLRLNEKLHSKELRDWAKTHVKPSTLSDIELKLREETKNQSFYLLFWLKSGEISATLFRAGGFEFVHKWPKVAFQPGSLNGIVDEYLRQAEEHSQNLSVQFLVSQEYFAWSPQTVLVQSALGERPLGSAYPTVMRWRERALGLPRTDHKQWAERAGQVLAHAEGCPALSCGWVDESLSQQDLRRLLARVGSDHQIVAFDFSAPRTLSVANNLLAAAILDGVPVILWPCDEPGDKSDIRKVLNEHAEKSKLDSLLRKMKDFYENDCTACKVTVFWDDPRVKPEKWEYADEF
jgi:hypothetical protein